MILAWVPSLVVKSWAALKQAVDRAWVWAGRGHVAAPITLGNGPHDCALASLYWAVPGLSEHRISEALQFCSKDWPYDGVTNTEFAVALKYLDVGNHYFGETETLGDLMARKPARCVALLPYHFIAVIDGRIVGSDADHHWGPSTMVYCSWEFR